MKVCCQFISKQICPINPKTLTQKAFALEWLFRVSLIPLRLPLRRRPPDWGAPFSPRQSRTSPASTNWHSLCSDTRHEQLLLPRIRKSTRHHRKMGRRELRLLQKDYHRSRHHCRPSRPYVCWPAGRLYHAPDQRIIRHPNARRHTSASHASSILGGNKEPVKQSSGKGQGRLNKLMGDRASARPARRRQLHSDRGLCRKKATEIRRITTL